MDIRLRSVAFFRFPGTGEYGSDAVEEIDYNPVRSSLEPGMTLQEGVS